MKYLLASAACVALLTGCATTTTPSAPAVVLGGNTGAYTVPVEPAPLTPAMPAKPTPEEATAFITDAEAKLADLNEYDQRAQWLGATFINFDSEWLQTKADAALNEATVKYAMESAQYNDVDADPVTRRKLDLLRISQTLPAAAEPGAAEELSAVAAKLGATYSTGKFTWKGKTYNLDDASDVMAKSRDPLTTRAMWEGWMSIAAPMKDDYAKLTELSNKGAQGLGFKDTGALWRSGYDMDPDAFAAETDKLFSRFEAVECGQPLEWRVSIRPAVDFGPQKVKFLIQAFFSDLDPPGFGAAVTAVGPAISACLEMILEIEGRVLRKDADARALARLVELGKRRTLGAVVSAGDHLEQREAVIDGAVSIVEIAALPDQVAELRSFIAAALPVDLGNRARPCFARKELVEGFAERPVEAGVVGDHEVGRLDDGPDRRHVEHLAGNHLIGDAG